MIYEDWYKFYAYVKENYDEWTIRQLTGDMSGDTSDFVCAEILVDEDDYDENGDYIGEDYDEMNPDIDVYTNEWAYLLRHTRDTYGNENSFWHSVRRQAPTQGVRL